MDDLKPCPFCGDAGKLDFDVFYGDRVHCFSCEGAGPWKEGQQQAVDAWNQRQESVIQRKKGKEASNG